MTSPTQPIQIPDMTHLNNGAFNPSSVASSPPEFEEGEQDAVFSSSLTSQDGSLYPPPNTTGHASQKGVSRNGNPQGKPRQDATSRPGYAALSQENGDHNPSSPTASNTLYFQLDPDTRVQRLVRVGSKRVEDITRDKTPEKCCSPRRKCCYAITAFVLACITTLGIVI